MPDLGDRAQTCPTCGHLKTLESFPIQRSVELGEIRSAICRACWSGPLRSASRDRRRERRLARRPAQAP